MTSFCEIFCTFCLPSSPPLALPPPAPLFRCRVDFFFFFLLSEVSLTPYCQFPCRVILPPSPHTCRLRMFPLPARFIPLVYPGITLSFPFVASSHVDIIPLIRRPRLDAFFPYSFAWPPPPLLWLDQVWYELFRGNPWIMAPMSAPSSASLK